MKRIVLSLLVSLLTIGAMWAQPNKVTSAYMAKKNREYDKALLAINEAVNNSATEKSAEAWMYRGDIYSDIYSSTEPKIKSLSDDPLHEAIISYVNVVKFDDSKKLRDAEKAQNMLMGLASKAYNDGAKAMNDANYEKTLKSFEDFYLAYNNLGNFKKDMDAAFKNIGLKIESGKMYMAFAAQQLKNNEKAINYYNDLINAKYGDPNVYVYLYDIYKEQGKDDLAIATLDKGLNSDSVKDKKNLMIEKLNYYIVKDKKEEAISIGKEALKADPENISLYIAMGNIYEVLKMNTEADQMYKKAIELDPNSYKTNSAVGLNLFNQGVEFYNRSVQETKLAEMNKYENKAKEIWEKAIPYLEKATKLEMKDDADRATMGEVYGALAEMYAKMNNVENANKYRKLQQEYKAKK